MTLNNFQQNPGGPTVTPPQSPEQWRDGLAAHLHRQLPDEALHLETGAVVWKKNFWLLEKKMDFRWFHDISGTLEIWWV